MIYTEDYFRTGNYVNYLDRYERYKQLMRDLTYLFDQTNMLSRDSMILDFGCGVGHCVRALKELGFHWTIGYDISDWAVDKGNETIRAECSESDDPLSTDLNTLSGGYWMVLMLDVLEHMRLDEIDATLEKLKTELIVVRVPITASVGGDYVLEASRLDKSHITKLTRSEWQMIFSEACYKMLFTLNLGTIWDSKGVFSAVFAKQ